MSGTRLARLAAESGVVGCQLAVLRHGTLKTWEHGEEEYGTGSPVTTDSVFAYGSVTKTLTALSVAQLVADGDLALDAPVREWIPELAAVGGQVQQATLRGLLSHTAGLPSDHDDPDAPSLARWTAGFLAAGQDRAGAPWPEPGSFSYANTGYALAGRAVETATGLPWWQAVQDYLLRPLGTRVGLLPGGAGGARTVTAAPGHRIGTAPGGDRVVHRVPCATDPGSAPAGGLAGSAADLVRAARPLLAEPGDGLPDGLVDPDVLRELARPVPGAEPFGLAAAWGLGLGHYGPATDRWLGHDGGLDGTTCHLRIHPERGVVVALTTNSAGGQDLWDALVGAPEVGVGVHRPDAPAAVPADAFQDCAGTYRNGELAVTVALDGDGRLVLALPGGAREPAVPRAGRVFTGAPGTPGAHVQGRFLRDPVTGGIAALQYSGRTLMRDTRERTVTP
ncbi:serine hydrolase domain-containing protein [Streptomyces sp. NPDC047928]|uniref:serine hydrolase domain-containing protein n=1 Tax=unclassified Streptomyces TaxID=2593676 RepID=UPI00371DAAEF